MNELLLHPILGNPIENIFWFGGILVGGLLLKRLISRGLSFFIFKVVQKYATNVGGEKLFSLLKRPMELAIVLLVMFFAFNHLNFPVEWKVGPKEVFGVRMFIHRSFYAAFAIACTWMVLRMIDFLALTVTDQPERSKSEQQLVIYIKEITKIVIGSFSIVLILGNIFKVDITSLIAGLVIGGLAVALAAKESLENLIASCTIFFDKSFIAGDSIKIGKIEGTVEKIGFRSTLIQTPEKSYLTVPNKKLVDTELDNISRRTEQKVLLVIQLKYGIPTADLKLLLANVKDFIDKIEELNTAENRVTLLDLTTSGIKLEIVYFVKGNSGKVYFETREKINLEILSMVEKFHGAFAVDGAG